MLYEDVADALDEIALDDDVYSNHLDEVREVIHEEEDEFLTEEFYD